MAYASLVVVTKVIDQILPDEPSYNFICRKYQMSALRKKVVRFQQFFEHISGKPRFSEVDGLESRIRDAAYKMEDILESILVCSVGKEDEHEVDLQLEFASCVEKVDLLLRVAMKMEKEVLDNKVKSGTSIYSHNFIAKTSAAIDIGLVGREHDLKMIFQRVIDIDMYKYIRFPEIEVIPITGMGGIGKTTLARAVYQYRGVRQHFDILSWATVSQDYDVQDILRQLAENMIDGAIVSEPDPIVRAHQFLKGRRYLIDGAIVSEPDPIVRVHQFLKGRRYLIILDDMWDVKVWDGVRNAFPHDNNGSRIIVTTRLSTVATYVCSSFSHPHQMQLLNEEQSWDLLRQTVYGKGADCPGELEDVGRKISRNCQGLPLALIVTGGDLLKFSKDKDYWEEVAARKTAAAKYESLLEVLTSSYTNLPPHLKACFLYLGTFLEDEEIPTDKLVMLWSAEGFLKPKESKTVEEVAEECLEELVKRSLVLARKKRYNGKTKTSRIHHAMRDLSLIQAQEEKFLYCQGSNDYAIDDVTFQGIIKDHQRRVSFTKFSRTCNVSFDLLVRTFRTRDFMDAHELSIIVHSKLLRVLERVCMKQHSSLRVLLRLANLRYIHFEEYLGDDAVVIPESVSQLRNLETLMVSGWRSDNVYMFVMPKQIWEMPRLRHLVSERSVLLLPLPASDLNDSSIDSSSLRTLRGVVNFDFTPSVIEKLQNLKKLKIYYKKHSLDYASVDWRGSLKVYSLENLANLYHLEHLAICCEVRGPRVTNICFPQKLKELSLESTKLPWEDMELIGELEHLEVLKLHWNAFKGDIWEPIEGGFLQLKYLKMEGLDLKEWRARYTDFPSLEKLVIDVCWFLEEVPYLKSKASIRYKSC